VNFTTKFLGIIAVLFHFVLFLRCTSLDTLLLLLCPSHSAVFAFTMLTSMQCILYTALLASKQTKVSVWKMPIVVCTVLNSWWWTERSSEKCSVFISLFNQLDAQIFFFTISFISCLYTFRAHVLIIRRSKLHYTASGIITPIGV